jgi:nicotinamide-nucleotide amidase
MKIDPELYALAEKVLILLRARGEMAVTAESCTGGLIAGVLTAVPGSSDVVERGFVTYTNEAKTELLGVPASLIAAGGAVAAPVAKAMAEGALAASRAQNAVSVTGVAGPGQSEAKPAGLVFIGHARAGAETRVAEHRFEGGRDAVRHASIRAALEMLLADAAP